MLSQACQLTVREVAHPAVTGSERLMASHGLVGQGEWRPMNVLHRPRNADAIRGLCPSISIRGPARNDHARGCTGRRGKVTWPCEARTRLETCRAFGAVQSFQILHLTIAIASQKAACCWSCVGIASMDPGYPRLPLARHPLDCTECSRCPRPRLRGFLKDDSSRKQNSHQFVNFCIGQWQKQW